MMNTDKISAEDIESRKKMIQKRFMAIRDHFICRQNGEGNQELNESLEVLRLTVPAKATMDMIVPFLFREMKSSVMSDMSTGDDEPCALISSQDALSVLQCLVASDSSYYLLEASQAVQREAVRLSLSSELMNVSLDLLNVIVQQLSAPNVTVSENATSTLIALSRKLDKALLTPTLSRITEAWRFAYRPNIDKTSRSRDQATTVAVRCANTLVQLLCLVDGVPSESLLRQASAIASEVLLTMLTEASDPLVQMSVVDMLDYFATSHPMHHWRAHWLCSRPVRDPLLQLCGGLKDNEQGERLLPDPILGAPALRVVSALFRIAHTDSTFFEDMNPFEIRRSFLESLKSFEESISCEMDRIALIDAISSFAGFKDEALNIILTDPETINAWLSLSVAQPKLKGVVLCSVARVLDPLRTMMPNKVFSNTTTPTTRDRDASLTSSTAIPGVSNGSKMKVYAKLGQVNGIETTNLVMSFVKSPFPEIRLAAYTLLIAVAPLPVGVQELFVHPDFVTFLLGSSHVPHQVRRDDLKEGRELKWELTRTILHSPSANLLARDILKQIETIVKRGPHYLPTQSWEVATE